MKFWLIVSCLFFLACSKTSLIASKVVRIHLTEDPTSLDPRKARDLGSTILLHMLFEGLTRVSQDGSAELALAEKVETSDDGCSFTFFLKDSHWSDGSAVTAQDFEKSWKTILDPNFPTDIAYHLYGIKNGKKAKAGEIGLEEVGVRAIDAKTLVVELEHPIPYFFDLLAMAPFFPVPSKVVEGNPAWASSPATHISNGPFALRVWNHSDSLSLEKNTHYWQADQLSLDRIDLIVAASDTGFKMFERGELDWTGSPLATIPPDAIAACKEKLSISPFAATYFFRVNTAPDKGNPLSDPRLRKALALSLDRQALVQHVLQGGHQAAIGLVPPEMGLRSQKNLFDEQKAKELMAEVRREWKEIPPIVLSYTNNQERNVAIAQTVQKQWEKTLGISIELEAVEPKIYFQRISKKQFQLAAGSWTADFDDPINFLEVFKYKEASTNNTHWERAEYIDLLDRSALCRDLNERKELLAEAEEMLLEEMPIIPIFHFALNYLKGEKLQGVKLSPLGRLDLRWAYWEKDEKR